MKIQVPTIDAATQLYALIGEKYPFFPLKSLPNEFINTVNMMFGTEPIVLDRERLNILLSFWSLPPMNIAFYRKYFGNGTISIEKIYGVLDEITKDFLWHFGSLERGYRTLCKHPNPDAYYDAHKFDIQEFRGRMPWHLVEQIVPEERGFLGYVSGQRTNHEKKLMGVAGLVLDALENNHAVYNKWTVEAIKADVIRALKESNPDIQQILHEIEHVRDVDLNLFSVATLDSNRTRVNAHVGEIEATLAKIEDLKAIGKRNQEHYLRNIESIDVYVATSMRTDNEYLDMYNFVTSTFSDENVRNLNIRYFDPTLCYCDSRIDKGIIECLLVRSTKVTIYCAQEGDTFGKDSELAATMAQGKPVIIYVPVASEDDLDIAQISDIQERKAKLARKSDDLDRRAKMFKEFHPLGLQIGLADGVARGVIVVRSAAQCSKILYSVLNNALDVEIGYEEHGVVLRETTTKSVLRVMTGWKVLANCFWNQFDKTQHPKSGLVEKM